MVGAASSPGRRPASDEPADVFEAASRLFLERRPFVLATVVRAVRPSSAGAGARALVLPDGNVRGFVGGSCVRPAVLRESRRAFEDGRPRLLRVSPDPPATGEPGREEGVLDERMACMSGGTLEIHVEPFLPRPRLVVAGDSPVAKALSVLAEAAGMEVVRADDGSAPDRLAEICAGAAAVVAAGHGEGEWDALRAALGGPGSPLVGLVASPKRARSVRERLSEAGVSEERLQRFQSPAGLDIGAATPAEIAVSILAEIVRFRRQDMAAVATGADAEAGDGEAVAPVPEGYVEPATLVDPVCGMTVPQDSPHRVEASGRTWLFCCAGCAETFRSAQPVPAATA